MNIQCDPMWFFIVNSRKTTLQMLCDYMSRKNGTECVFVIMSIQKMWTVTYQVVIVSYMGGAEGEEERKQQQQKRQWICSLALTSPAGTNTKPNADSCHVENTPVYKVLLPHWLVISVQFSALQGRLKEIKWAAPSHWTIRPPDGQSGALSTVP